MSGPGLEAVHGVNAARTRNREETHQYDKPGRVYGPSSQRWLAVLASVA